MMYHLVKGDHHLKSTLFRVNFKVENYIENLYTWMELFSDGSIGYPKPGFWGLLRMGQGEMGF